AQTGATLAELQARLGHSTVQAAMRYQHAAAGRDAKIAEAMSNVIPLKPKPVEVEPVEDFTAVWFGIPGGRWHLAGDAGRSYCNRRIDPRAQRRVQDAAPGPVCRACAQLRQRRA
ncbi:MAG: hypothetical protein WCF04_13735, partial [Candidatus Nanopelagicales bacterium]